MLFRSVEVGVLAVLDCGFGTAFLPVIVSSWRASASKDLSSSCSSSVIDCANVFCSVSDGCCCDVIAMLLISDDGISGAVFSM